MCGNPRCANCHDLHTRGHIPRQALEAWKQMLMLVAASLDRESLDLLLFMNQFEKKTLELEKVVSRLLGKLSGRFRVIQ